MQYSKLQQNITNRTLFFFGFRYCSLWCTLTLWTNTISSFWSCMGISYPAGKKVLKPATSSGCSLNKSLTLNWNAWILVLHNKGWCITKLNHYRDHVLMASEVWKKPSHINSNIRDSRLNFVWRLLTSNFTPTMKDNLPLSSCCVRNQTHTYSYTAMVYRLFKIAQGNCTNKETSQFFEVWLRRSKQLFGNKSQMKCNIS